MKTSPPQFNLLTTPLSQTNLIEASAGTGKTYTITALFLRLILEKKFSADKILVVTFTEAATAELKERTLSTLRKAATAFSEGHYDKPDNKTEAEFLNGLIQEYGKAGLELLNAAIRNFDEAAIFTIHGFCHRMLHNYAFESRTLFDTELVTDQAELIQETVEDFWRKHFYNESLLFTDFALNSKKITLDTFISLLRNSTSHPRLNVIPEIEDACDASEQESHYQKAFDTACDIWQTSISDIESLLMDAPGLDRRKYRRDYLSNWIAEMDEYLMPGRVDTTLCKNFARFTVSNIKGASRGNHAPPEHPFFDHCEVLKDRHTELTAIFEKKLLKLKTDLFGYAATELPKRKQAKNTQFFDDLLLNLYHALDQPGGKALAKDIRSKFSAALIDEFQDTDPVQYAIFRKIFDTKESILFLIGDPKQAIYGFRGADIFTYMDAAKRTDFHHTLGENWRSEPRLITGVNTIFANASQSFVYHDIPFIPVRPAHKPDPEYLKINGKDTDAAPLQLWFVPEKKDKEDKKNKPVSKSEAQDLIIRAVAGEISRLLTLGRDHKAMLGDKPLMPADIAVLVRKNAEARMIQSALLALNIPGVLYSAGNIFDSPEAFEMERVLSGIVQFRNEKNLRSALATEMIGIKGEELNRIIENEIEWEKWLIRFREYHTIWNQKGFMRMFNHLLIQENMLSRVMRFSDGERRSTNILHLAELLHQISVEKKLGMTWLVKWLSEQRNPNTRRAEEHQLRLESDENAVRLVTIHKSKGLEYPVVFCPFTWGGSRIKKDAPPLFHDDSGELTLDIGSETEGIHRQLAEKELLAENLRLFYVALTRARNRCYLAWGRFNKADTSAPAYLFHPPAISDDENLFDAMTENFAQMTSEDMFESLKSVENKSDGSIAVYEISEAEGRFYTPFSDEPESPECRKFTGKIEQQFRVSSFSALTSGKPLRAELADYDESTGEQETDQIPEQPNTEAAMLPPTPHTPPPRNIFSFPKGARAGIFMHDIFEHLDFTKNHEEHVEKLVEEKLKAYDFEYEWLEAICEMVRNVLSVPLTIHQNHFTLSRILDRERLNELEFYFPLNPLSPGILKNIFGKHTNSQYLPDLPVHMGRLDFSPVRGFMKGFMDMVFRFDNQYYLVDWKSNHLGDTVDAYHHQALTDPMITSYYILQYHIYTVALHQYLQLRIPDYDYETHFGGIFYVFLRGVASDKGAEYGIYRDKPPSALIKELCHTLIRPSRQ